MALIFDRNRWNVLELARPIHEQDRPVSDVSENSVRPETNIRVTAIPMGRSLPYEPVPWDSSEQSPKIARALIFLCGGNGMY